MRVEVAAWAFRPNEPYGFYGRKATLNRAGLMLGSLGIVRHWSQFVPNMSTDIRGHEALHHHHQSPRSRFGLVSTKRLRGYSTAAKRAASNWSVTSYKLHRGPLCSQQTRELISTRKTSHTDTTTTRPESRGTVSLTWHARKYTIHKLHQRIRILDVSM